MSITHAYNAGRALRRELRDLRHAEIELARHTAQCARGGRCIVGEQLERAVRAGRYMVELERAEWERQRAAFIAPAAGDDRLSRAASAVRRELRGLARSLEHEQSGDAALGLYRSTAQRIAEQLAALGFTVETYNAAAGERVGAHRLRSLEIRALDEHDLGDGSHDLGELDLIP